MKIGAIKACFCRIYPAYFIYLISDFINITHFCHDFKYFMLKNIPLFTLFMAKWFLYIYSSICVYNTNFFIYIINTIKFRQKRAFSSLLGKIKKPVSKETGFLVRFMTFLANYLPGKKGHTIGITTKDTTKQTMIKPVPAFT